MEVYRMRRYRISNVIKRNKFILLLAMILIGVCIQPMSIHATESYVIKVGYPNVSGFTEVKDGVYTGYAYEYLMELAKYTGWEYEFIEMSLNDLIYKLRDGEIDLGAGMLKNEHTIELYDFPEENAGYTYTTLITLKDNDSLSGSNYETLNGIKVGYYETSQVRLSDFLKFCEDNEIQDVELISYAHDGIETMMEVLKTKEVDAFIEGNLLLQDEHKVIAKFGAIPYYFATTKGNKEVLTRLNKALSQIKKNDSNFNQRLYNKYFENYIEGSISLTQEEQDYINHMTPLKAVYVDNLAPIQDYNPKTMQAEGIYIDIMSLIAQKSGLQYELVKASSYDEAYQMIKNKEVDLIIGAPDNYLEATKYECTLTQPYFEVNMVRVIDANQQSQESKQVIALPRGYFFTEFDGEYEIQYYETIGDCLTAVKTGKASATYGNSYTISNYLSVGYYPSLSTFFEEIPIKAAIGISKPTDLTLMNIINKSVSNLSDSEIKNIIYANTMNVQNHVTLKQFFFDNILFCCGVILTFMFLIYIIVRTKFKRLVEDKLLLLEKSQTDVLTGVYNREAGTNLVTTYLQTKEPSLYTALIIIDIDHFKQVNDYLGHQVGDALLVEFSRLLKQLFSYKDIIFRLGGDEFIVFMTNLESNNLEIVDEKLSELFKIMNKEVSYKGHSQKISLSVGAVITNQVHDFSELYQEADQILYEVKGSGRNGFKIKKLF